MAVTWDVNITNVDVDSKRADISFVRTDTVTSATESYSFKKAVIETAQQRSDLLNTVWSKHEDAATEQTAVEAFITNLEQTGKSNLEAREA